MLRNFILAILLGATLTACALPGADGAPTLYPSGYLPTVIYLTAASIDAATARALPPTPTLTATADFIPATIGPSATPTTGPGIPLGAIQIKAPGPMSRVVSPLQVQMLAVAGESHRMQIDLFGEDGRLLGRTLSAVFGSPDGDPLAVKIPFEIRAAGENGFVQVSTKDAQGRVQSLVTLRILLLSSGVSQINPPGNTIYEQVVFSNLAADSNVSGGVLPVEGQFMPYSRKAAVLSLKGEDGRLFSQRVLPVAGTDWQPFSTTLPFKVDKTTPAYLVVEQGDDVLNGQAYVYTRALTLNP
jgi:hypothetical protein